MMKIVSKVKYLLLIGCVIFATMFGGVCATWFYASQPAASVSQSHSVSVSEFEYTPEEVIPGGDIEAPLGENHLDLITLILNDDRYGLNATQKPIIHNLLKNPGDVIYCDQNVQGGNLKHLMIDSSSATDQLGFVITKVSDTEYHAFTFCYHDVRNGEIGSNVQAYKTILEKKQDGIWYATKSYMGYAAIFSPGIVSVSIDYRTWQQT